MTIRRKLKKYFHRRILKFWSSTNNSNISIYGLEVAINKDDDESDEFIVHLNYIGKRKVDKTYEKLKKKKTTIDSKK